MLDFLYFILLSGSFFVITFFMRELIRYFNYDIDISDTLKLFVEPDKENDYEEKTITIIRGYIDEHLKLCIKKKYDNVIALTDFYKNDKTINNINKIANAHKSMYDYIFSNEKLGNVVILCTMNTPRDYFDLINYSLINNFRVKLNICNINPISDYLTRSMLIKYKKRKYDYFTYSINNDFSVKKIINTLSHTILGKNGDKKYKNKIILNINKENALYQKLNETIPKEYQMNEYQIGLGLTNLEENEMNEDIINYIEDISLKQVIDNQYYKLLLIDYKVKEEFEKYRSKSFIPPYGFVIMENSTNMPIDNFFKLPMLVKS